MLIIGNVGWNMHHRQIYTHEKIWNSYDDTVLRAPKYSP